MTISEHLKSTDKGWKQILCDIYKWQVRLGLEDWDVRTEKIDPEQVDYNGEDYFIGIERDFDGRNAVIYHDIPLDEQSIVHELCHILFPEEDGESHKNYERFIDEMSKDLVMLYEMN